ncbi:MAG TPA: FAD-dependent oxidoreductase [Candidatus Saccharimonadales bacterium]|nr:FAD-dependent oxidoreductase [Candidatus Saccharimonadales bacterium]
MNITIVGGGFGGVKTALELAEDKSNQITLITDKPDFQYYPALYSAATGHSHLESWVPLGTIFAGKHNVHVHIDSIESIDPKAKTLKGDSGVVYDYERCILALGTVTTYFGIKGLETYAYGIKSAPEIKRLKQHVYVDIAENHTTDKHYIIVGAGPTGVELAAALGSYLARMCEHYGIEKPDLKIDLIEAAPRILPRMSEKSSKKVQKRLEKLGVNVQTGKTVEAASADDLTVSGNSINSRTIIWTSGVANHPFYKNNAEHFEFAKNGRIVVDKYMQAGKNIYVIGDNAATPYTGLAQTALHDAMFVSGNLKRQAKHKKPRTYKAVMPPVVVPVGENWAVFEWHGLRLYGWMASLLRRAADIIGYSDMLPLGQALGVWRASTIMEDDYFTPTSPGK